MLDELQEESARIEAKLGAVVKAHEVLTKKAEAGLLGPQTLERV